MNTNLAGVEGAVQLHDTIQRGKSKEHLAPGCCRLACPNELVNRPFEICGRDKKSWDVNPECLYLWA